MCMYVQIGSTIGVIWKRKQVNKRVCMYDTFYWKGT